MIFSSTDILGTVQNVQNKQPKKRKGSSSFFAEAFSNSNKLSPMQKRVYLKMAKNNLKNIQFSEKLTKIRRAQPLYPSQILGDSYKYGGK